MTQFNTVKNIISGKDMSIKEITETTGIKAPNVRRILGQGTKQGVFKRIAKGIYAIEIGNKTKALINIADSIQSIKKLKEENYKFDMVFLDIPYNTPAIKGGNRGVKYSLISPSEFKEFMTDLKDCITKDTPVYYMFSNAPSGWKKMDEYNNILITLGFAKIAEGGWQKMFKNGKKCTNVLGKISVREGLNLYNLSGKKPNNNIVMDFESTRPRTASEKCGEMLSTLINQSSNEGDLILDPFAGTGSTGEACLKNNRNVVLIEKSEDRVKNEIIPRLLKTA